VARSRPDLKVIAIFYPQYEDELDNILPDYDSNLWEHSFDITEDIIELGIRDALLTEDDQYSSDEFLPDEIRDAHGGPFQVVVESSIHAYFQALLGGYYSPDPLHYPIT
jgi:hypothetical protein